MADSSYEVVFSGRIASGLKRSTVDKRLRSQLKLSRRELKKLFGAGERVVMCSDDRTAAEAHAKLLEEAGVVCEVRRTLDRNAVGRDDIPVNTRDLAPVPDQRAAISASSSHTDMRKTLRQYLHIPMQTATGSWHFLRVHKPDGTSTRDLTEAASATLGRLKNSFHEPSSKSYAITRILAGILVAVPTGGIALGVGSGMLMDGAWIGGLFNMLFFGAIALYGIWMVVGGLRPVRDMQAVPPASGSATAAVLVPSHGGHASFGKRLHDNPADSADGDWTHPKIRSFMRKRLRSPEPCTYECSGTHLWGVTRDRRCENIWSLLAAASTCLTIGFWIPGFHEAALGLMLLMLVAAGLSRDATKPPRQFHLDLADEPPSWSSSDDEFWSPVMEYFELKERPRRGFWTKRKRD